MHNLSKRIQKRHLIDRRKQCTPFISRYSFFGGRREKIRRNEDKKDVFVDLYNVKLLLTILSILVLCLMDAYFTVKLIQKNYIVEANPVMALYLHLGIESFVLMKVIITMASLTILCLCKNFAITKVGLSSALIIYLFVVIYEINIIMYPFLQDFFDVLRL